MANDTSRNEVSGGEVRQKTMKKPLSGFKNIMMKEMEVMREGNRWIVWWVCSETKRD